jgi:mRNA interferase YafQ
MYRLVKSKKFDRSFKKLDRSGKFKGVVEEKFKTAVNLLLAGKKLPASYRDHQLTGDAKQYRECHIKGDLLLLYEILDDVLILVLIDIGSHSELFG